MSFALNAKRGNRDDGESETFIPLAPPLMFGSSRGGPNSLRPGFTGDGHIVAAQGVRRLTPVECERLQAWPDNWTNPTGDSPDSRRYAACGDGVTASVAEWIGRRILEVA